MSFSISASPTDIRNWLLSKSFSETIVLSFVKWDGAAMLGLSESCLKKIVPGMEGRRLLALLNRARTLHCEFGYVVTLFSVNWHTGSTSTHVTCLRSLCFLQLLKLSTCNLIVESYFFVVALSVIFVTNALIDFANIFQTSHYQLGASHSQQVQYLLISSRRFESDAMI